MTPVGKTTLQEKNAGAAGVLLGGRMRLSVLERHSIATLTIPLKNQKRPCRMSKGDLTFPRFSVSIQTMGEF